MTPRAPQSEQCLSAHLAVSAFAVNAVETRASVRSVTVVDTNQRPSILENRRRRLSRRVNH